MARWALSGSVGNVAGPLALTALLVFGVGWRWLFAGLAAITFALALVAHGRGVNKTAPSNPNFRAAISGAVQAFRSKSVVRWLILLQFSDLMLDVLLGFLALYFVDVVGAGSALAATAVTVWTGIGLAGDALPGKSGTAMAVDNVGNLVGGAFIIGLGFAAQRIGLGPTMWLLMLGPVALGIGLWRVHDQPGAQQGA